MSFPEVGSFYLYHDQLHAAGCVSGGAYEALRVRGRGSSGIASARATYLAALAFVDESKGHRCVWASDARLGARAGISDEAVGRAWQYLEDAGLAVAYRASGVDHGGTCYWLVDPVAEAKALAEWTAQRIVAVLQGVLAAQDPDAPPDPGAREAQARAIVDAEVDDAEARFKADWPGRCVTRGHVLAYLAGQRPKIGPRRTEGVARKRAAKAAVARAFAERGVENSDAAVAAFIADRTAAGLLTTARALREALVDGSLEERLPNVHAVLEGVNPPDVEVFDAGEKDDGTLGGRRRPRTLRRPAPAVDAPADRVAENVVESAPASVARRSVVVPTQRAVSMRERFERRGRARRLYSAAVADLRAAGLDAEEAADAVIDAVDAFEAAYARARGGAPTETQVGLALDGLGRWFGDPTAGAPVLDGLPVPVPEVLARLAPAAA